MRGTVSPTVTVEGGEAPWAVWLDGAPASLPIDTTLLADGPHALRFRSLGGLLQREGPAVERTLQVDNTPPTVRVSTRSKVVEQGSVLPLFFTLDEPGDLRVEVLDLERALHPLDGGMFRALVGISLRQPPGPLPVQVWVSDGVGNEAELAFDFDVVAFEWETGGKIRGVSMKRDSEAVATMRAERDAAYAAVLPEQRWRGEMLWPTLGRISSPYGKFRTYPDGSRSHHDAVDITRRAGTPVHAANHGTVLVARRQAILGNAVIVHHGQGVTTSYNHLSRIDVVEGELVQKGDRVGLMGNTGRSTGPHLHWGMVVDGIAVDASVWPEDGFADPGAFEILETTAVE